MMNGLARKVMPYFLSAATLVGAYNAGSNPSIGKRVVPSLIEKEVEIEELENIAGEGKAVRLDVNLNQALQSVGNAVRRESDLFVASYRVANIEKKEKLTSLTQIKTYYPENGKEIVVPSDGAVFYGANIGTNKYDLPMPIFSRATTEEDDILDKRVFQLNKDANGLIIGYFSPGIFFNSLTEERKRKMLEKGKLSVNAEIYQGWHSKQKNAQSLKFIIDFSDMKNILEGVKIKVDKDNKPVIIEDEKN